MYPDRLRKLRLPTLAYRRTRGDMIQAYKLLTDNNDGYDKSLPTLFTYSNTGLRGHSKKLFLPRSNKNIKKYFFTNRIINLWNNLPEDVVSAGSMIAFERGLDDFWKDQEMKYDNFMAEIST